ncbi:sugar phosphate isomerase/epimerase family protein [Catenovulum sediminis]|uniref:sugar phosphate isomerase/epimerase family protein n=1 Tax=Catenovulum sediminis TaxID=1740262 RepID=UPI0011810F2C|nr:sugar phosphate isomerase/epimerase [Catenovulum sediminis]
MKIFNNIGLVALISASLVMLGCTTKQQNTSEEKMPKISVQLWSVKDQVSADFKGTLKTLKNMGFDGVEFARNFGPYEQDPKGLKTFLDEIGLVASGAHVPFEALNEQNFTRTVAFYKTIECPMLIIPYDERAFSDDGIVWVTEELTRLSNKLAEHDIKVGYHNHAQEFNQYQDSTYWDYLAQNTPKSVVLQQDVGWTTYAGLDPVEYVNKYPGRTLTTHFKVRLPEGTQGKSPIIGQDTIDWSALIEANVKAGGTLWFVVEQEEYPNNMTPLEAVQASKMGLDKYLTNF